MSTDPGVQGVAERAAFDAGREYRAKWKKHPGDAEVESAARAFARQYGNNVDRTAIEGRYISGFDPSHPFAAKA